MLTLYIFNSYLQILFSYHLLRSLIKSNCSDYQACDQNEKVDYFEDSSVIFDFMLLWSDFIILVVLDDFFDGFSLGVSQQSFAFTFAFLLIFLVMHQMFEFIRVGSIVEHNGQDDGGKYAKDGATQCQDCVEIRENEWGHDDDEDHCDSEENI